MKPWDGDTSAVRGLGRSQKPREDRLGHIHNPREGTGHTQPAAEPKGDFAPQELKLIKPPARTFKTGRLTLF